VLGVSGCWEREGDREEGGEGRAEVGRGVGHVDGLQRVGWDLDWLRMRTGGCCGLGRMWHEMGLRGSGN
jgi:hypothetical protein